MMRPFKPFFIETDVKSVDPNQMLCSVASDLDLHCFSMSFLWTGIQMNFGLFSSYLLGQYLQPCIFNPYGSIHNTAMCI